MRDPQKDVPGVARRGGDLIQGAYKELAQPFFVQLRGSLGTIPCVRSSCTVMDSKGFKTKPVLRAVVCERSKDGCAGGLVRFRASGFHCFLHYHVQ